MASNRRCHLYSESAEGRRYWFDRKLALRRRIARKLRRQLGF